MHHATPTPITEQDKVQRTIEEDNKERFNKPLIANVLDPTHFSGSTKHEEEQAHEEGFENAKVLPGNFGLPLVGNSLSVIGTEGYDFFTNKAKQYAHEYEGGQGIWAGLFRFHIFGERAIAVTGVQETKDIFYNVDRAIRAGSMPYHLQHYFFGLETIVHFDGEEHTHRKTSLMKCFTGDFLKRYVAYYAALLEKYTDMWSKSDSKIMLRDEMCALHAEFALGMYLGVFNMDHKEAHHRGDQMRHLFEEFGAVPLPISLPGSRQSRASKAIHSLSEEIARPALRRHREAQKAGASPDFSVCSQMALGTMLSGELLPEEVIVHEMCNLSRPTCLAACFMTYLMDAVHENPKLKDDINRHIDEVTTQFKKDHPEHANATPSDLIKHKEYLDKLDYLYWVAMEIKRYYHNIPLLTARAKISFVYNGYFIPKDYLYVLGVPGVHRDPRVWTNPDTFDPMRFSPGREEDKKIDQRFAIVQQGGGDYIGHHKCAGELLASFMVMQFAVKILHECTWKFTEKQDFSISHRQMPPYPSDGILLEHVNVINKTTSPPFPV